MQDSHIGFVIAAYAVTGVTVLAMIVAIIVEHRSLTRALGRLSARGGPPANEGADRS
jgi:heme exporter protein CcmD